MGDVVNIKDKKEKKEEQTKLDVFKDQVSAYMESHGKSAVQYRTALDQELSKYMVDSYDGKSSKTLGEVLAPGGPLEDKMKDAFKSQLESMGIKEDKYVNEVLMRDLGVTIDELRDQYKGQLSNSYDSETIVNIMNVVDQKLGSKLTQAILNELGKLEGSDHYKAGLDHIMETAEIKSEFPSIHEDIKTHYEVKDKIQSPLYRSLGKKAKDNYQLEQYKKAV